MALAQRLKGVLVFTTLAGLSTVGLYLYLHLRTGAWQFLALAADSGSYVLLSAGIWWLIRRGKLYPALYIMSLAIALVIGVGAVLVSGLGQILGVAFLLIFPVLIAQLRLPSIHTGRLIGMSLIVGLVVLLLDFYGVGAHLDLPDQVILLFGGIVGVGGIGSLVTIARQSRWYSLRAKLIIAFAAASLLPLILLSGLVAWRVAQITRDRAGQALNLAAQRLADRVDLVLDAQRSTVRGEARLAPLARFLEEPQNPDYRTAALDLLRSLATRPYVSSYALLNLEGHNLLDSDPLLEGGDESGYEYVAGALNVNNVLRQPEPYISHVLLEPETGAAYYTIACAIRDLTGGQIVGVLRVRYQAETLQQWVTQVNDLVSPGSYGFILDEDLIRLADGQHRERRFTLLAPVAEELLASYQAGHRLPAGSLETLHTGLTAFAEALRNGATSFSGELEAGKEEEPSLEQGAIVRLQTVPWYVVYVQQQDAFLAPVRAQSRALLLVALLLAGLMTAMGWGVALALSRPVRALTAAAEQLAAGNLEVAIVPETADEIGLLAETFNTMVGRLREFIQTLEQRVAERTTSLSRQADFARLAVEVINAVTTELEPDELMRNTATLLVERFGFNHAGFLLVEEGGDNVRYHIGAGQGAGVLMREQFILPVGGKSLVGEALRRGEMLVVQDVGQEPNYYAHPAVPDTRAEVVIPLRARGRILGALSVQSAQTGSFDEATLAALRTIAAQVAVGLDNTRLLREAQQALEAERRAYGQVTRATWQELLRSGLTPGYRYANERLQPMGKVWHPEMDLALREGRVVTAVAEDAPELLTFAAPVHVRGQVIGVLNLRKPASAGRWHPEELRLLEALLAQLEVALESAQLYQDTQRRAAREQELSELSAQFSRSLDVEALLRTAVQELGRLPGVAEVAVHILPQLEDESAQSDQGTRL